MSEKVSAVGFSTITDFPVKNIFIFFQIFYLVHVFKEYVEYKDTLFQTITYNLCMCGSRRENKHCIQAEKTYNK